MEEDSRRDAPLSHFALAEYGEVNSENGTGDRAATRTLYVRDRSPGGTGVTYAVTYHYGGLPVESDGTVRQFYYIRQDDFTALAPPGTDPATIIQYRTFGPHPIGARVYARLGDNYYFIPICGERFASNKALEIQASEPPPVFRLSCAR